MANYILSNKAVEDLSTIWNYTVDEWSEFQADKYYRQLIEAFQHIADAKVKGKVYPEVKENLLGFKVGQHIVFYLKGKQRIEIIRILHSRMDLKNRIKEG